MGKKKPDQVAGRASFGSIFAKVPHSVIEALHPFDKAVVGFKLGFVVGKDVFKIVSCLTTLFGLVDEFFDGGDVLFKGVHSGYSSRRASHLRLPLKKTGMLFSSRTSKR